MLEKWWNSSLILCLARRQSKQSKDPSLNLRVHVYCHINTSCIAYINYFYVGLWSGTPCKKPRMEEKVVKLTYPTFSFLSETAGRNELGWDFVNHVLNTHIRFLGLWKSMTQRYSMCKSNIANFMSAQTFIACWFSFSLKKIADNPVIFANFSRGIWHVMRQELVLTFDLLLHNR